MKAWTLNRNTAVGLALAALALTPCVTSAEVVFDNFHGSFMTDTGASFGCGVAGPSVPCGSPSDEAMSFEITGGAGLQGFYLESITVPVCLWTKLYCLPNPYPSFSVCVYSDLGGEPGTLLEAVQVTQSSKIPVLTAATFGGSTLLSVGSRYWVALCGVSSSNHGWAFPDPLVNTGHRMYRYGAGDTWKHGTNDGAFRVEGTPAGPVPVDSKTWGQVKTLLSR